MTEKDLISQLKKLKAVEPDKNWLMAARGEVLSKTPVFDVAVKTGFNISSVRAGNYRDEKFFIPETDDLRRDKKSFVFSKKEDTKFCVPTFSNKERNFSFPTFRFRSLFNFKQFQPAMASLMIGTMILGGGSILTVRAAQDSLPGDSLYGVKRMLEGTQITIASNEKKPILETEFVGRRLEEMARISEKTSDIEQEEKIKKLAQEVEEGMKKTENHLAALSESPKEAAKAAKTVNVQTEKYADILVKTNEKLPEPVKEKVGEVIVKAVDTTEKVNFRALGIMANAADNDNLEEAEISKEEVAVLIQDKADEIISDSVKEEGIENLEIGKLEDEEKEEIGELEIGEGESEDDGEIKIETEKIEIDCSECDDDGENICLEEADEKENIKCYIEQVVPTVEDKLGEKDFSGAMEILKKKAEIKDEGNVKGEKDKEVKDKEVLDDDDGVISE